MSKMEVISGDSLTVECIHENGASFLTDAPKDVGGKANYFSPTDLLTISLISCMIITMELKARKMGLDLKKVRGSVEKKMTSTAPRRIGEIVVSIRSSFEPSVEQQRELETAALGCPVHHTLHPETKQTIEFLWGVTALV